MLKVILAGLVDALLPLFATQFAFPPPLLGVGLKLRTMHLLSPAAVRASALLVPFGAGLKPPPTEAVDALEPVVFTVAVMAVLSPYTAMGGRFVL